MFKFSALFPDIYGIVVDGPSEEKDDSFNEPGFLQHSYSFQEWRADVLPALRKIASTKSGMVLLNAIQATGKRIRISSNWQPECNAGTQMTAAPDSTGRHFKVQIFFDPKMYMSGSECYKRRLKMNSKPRAALPDEVLFHELIHAYRYLTVVDADDNPVHGGLKRYDLIGDVYAIVLTNIYISDASNRHSSGLRADHDHFRPLQRELSHSFTFYQSSPQALTLMDQLVKTNPFLARGLSRVKAGFNPLAAYFQNYRAVKALSQSPLSRMREFVIGRLPVISDPIPLPLQTVPEATPLEQAAKFLKDDVLARMLLIP